MDISKRRDPRYRARLEVQFRDKAEFLREYTENLSKGGAFVQTSNPFKLGDFVSLVLHLPQAERPIELEASVVHIRRTSSDVPGGIGVEFLAFQNGAARTTLEAHVASLGEEERI